MPPETTVQEEQGIEILPFAIEIDEPRNRNQMIQSIPGLVMRSAIDGSRHIIDAKTGEERVPLDQARQLSSFPKTPGMRLYVNPETCEYVVEDPLRKDEAMCERIKKWMDQNAPMKTAGKINGVEKQAGKLDRHRFKTLCREMIWLVDSGCAKRCKGAIPTIEEVDQLPGHYLLNPGSRVGNTQPMFEKDWDKWVENLANMGG